MEPESWLPHLHVSATCPYPEPARSSPSPHIPFAEAQSYLPIYAWIFQVGFFFTFPHQNPVYAFPLPYTCYRPRPSHSSLFYHPKNIGWAVQFIKLLIAWFSPLPCHLVPLRPQWSPQHPILKHPQAEFLPQCQRPRFTPIQSNSRNYSVIQQTL